MKKIVLFLILIGAVVLRFLYIERYFRFGTDEEYIALLAWSQIKDFHPVWIGVSASNVGFYLGPGLIYFTAIFLKLSQGNPIILGYLAGIAGILTVFSIYFIVKKCVNEKSAFIASILYAFSPFMVLYDRKFWPFAIPLVTIWLLFSIAKIKNDSRFVILASFLMGVAYHLHMTLFLFWPLLLITIFLNRKSVRFRILIASIATFVLSTLPLLIFDIVHNFDNILFPLRLFTQPQQSERESIVHVLVFYSQTITSFFSNQLIFQTPAIALFITGILLMLAFYTMRMKKKLFEIYTSTMIVLFTGGIFIFAGPVQQYYFVFLAPLIFILTSFYLAKIPYKFIVLFLLLFVFINSYAFFRFTPRSDYLEKKNSAIQVKEKVKNSPYELIIKDNYLYDGGWRYIFQTFGKTPNTSSADSIFGWIYQDEIKDNSILTVTVDGKTGTLNYSKK